MILTHHGIDSMVRPGGGGTEYEVTIGESSISPSRYRTQLPWDGLYRYSLSQQIYSSNEIGTSGKITDISFYCFVGYLSWNVSIYMSHTSKASLYTDASNSEKLQDNEYVQDTSLVYNGSVYLGSTDNKWFKIPLSTPFEYDNSHNLLLTVCSNNPSNPSKELRFAVLWNNSNIPLYNSSGNAEYKPTTNTYEMNTAYYRNVIKLNMLV